MVIHTKGTIREITIIGTTIDTPITTKETTIMVGKIGETIGTTVTMVENNGRTIGINVATIEEIITGGPVEIAMDEITTGASG